MQFKISAASVLAFVASTIAQTAGFDSVFAPASWEAISAGETFTVQWQVPAAYKGKTVSLSLIGGETQGTQVPLLDIASGISNDAGSYSWSVPADLGAAKVYGLVIKLSDDASVFQYSNPFTIDGPAEADATTEVVVSATTAVTDYGVKTVSLSSATAVVYSTTAAPVADYTTVVPVVNTVTVPCNGTATPPPYTAPAQPTAPVVPNPYSNSTWTTNVVVPPATTAGGSSGATTTPEVPVTGAGARFGAGSFAVVGGLLIAALAL